jgi:hypothetical protein
MGEGVRIEEGLMLGLRHLQMITKVAGRVENMGQMARPKRMPKAVKGAD